MAFIAKIVNVAGKVVKLDPTSGDITAAELYSPAGDDAPPLETDYAVAANTLHEGAPAVFGFIDLQNNSKAAKGEKRIYARDSTGAVVAEFWLKNDGSIEGSNSLGSFKLLATGDFVVNGVTIDTTGDISANSITIGGISFVAHVHSGVTTGGDVTGGPQ